VGDARDEMRGVMRDEEEVFGWRVPEEETSVDNGLLGGVEVISSVYWGRKGGERETTDFGNE